MVGDIWQNQSDLETSMKILNKVLQQKSFTGAGSVIDMAGGIGRVA
jgi:hypothetical protein